MIHQSEALISLFDARYEIRRITTKVAAIPKASDVPNTTSALFSPEPAGVASAETSTAIVICA
jgi:hypothetical protein